MDVIHAWDAAGNLATRQDVLTSETESFGYDFLDRLTTVSGAYNNSFAYDEIGNMQSKNGVSYSYDSTQPHAVDSVGGLSYTYDSNGNMTYRGSDNQTITWDVENRPITVSENGTTIATFIYDGNGNRIKKTESGETVLFINRYYEKNLTTGNVTTSYYLGSRLVAQREGTELRYIHQDHLSGTSLTTSDNGTVISSIKYFPFGETKSGDASTDIKFTGQRLDGTGLYYYGARYYDPLIGRFVSPDTIIPNPSDPQAFNRYTYCLNNPLKYVDPTGNFNIIGAFIGAIAYTVTKAVVNLATNNWDWHHALDNWSWRDLAFATAVGMVTWGVGTAYMMAAQAGLITTTEVVMTDIALGIAGGNVAYLWEVHEGKVVPSVENRIISVCEGVASSASGGINECLPIITEPVIAVGEEYLKDDSNNPSNDITEDDTNTSENADEDLSGSYLYAAYLAGIITYEEFQNIVSGKY